MRPNLHANATTGAKDARLYPEQQHLGGGAGRRARRASEEWRDRATTVDRSHRMATSLSPLEETLVVELRSLRTKPFKPQTNGLVERFTRSQTPHRGFDLVCRGLIPFDPTAHLPSVTQQAFA